MHSFFVDEIDSDLERDIAVKTTVTNNSTPKRADHDEKINDGETEKHKVTEIVELYSSVSRQHMSGSRASHIIGGTDVFCSRDQSHGATSIRSQNSVFGEGSEDEEADEETSIPAEQVMYNQILPKIFTFSLPFAGTSTSQLSPLTTLKSIIPYQNKYELFSSEKSDIPSKHEIKQKLRRQESISTIEEITLFQGETGNENVRSLALKETFQIDVLKNPFKSIGNNKSESDDFLISRTNTIYDQVDGNFVVIGGYRGSVLRDAKTKRRFWIPLRAGLNLRKVDLLIGPEEEDEKITQEKIIPDGMLTHVGPVDISRKLIRRLQLNPNVEVEDFGYDWRLSIGLVADHLKDRLQTIYDSQKDKKGTYIIAHSMGGLVAHKVLQDYTHLVRGIIYVGSPSQCPNILGPLRFGDEVLLNKKILNDEATFFMRSSFSFLPLDGRCFVDKNQKVRYDLDFFDPQVWIDLGLSPLVSSSRKKNLSPIKSKGSMTSLVNLNAYVVGSQKLIKNLNPVTLLKNITSINETLENEQQSNECEYRTSYAKSLEYLERTLKKTKEFLLSLEYQPGKEYPPLAIVYGNQVPTVRGAKINGLQDIIDGNYSDFYYGPGDGVVHHHWLLPERRGFPVVAKVTSPTGHVSLLGDLTSVGEALIAIVDKEKQNNEKHAKA